MGSVTAATCTYTVRFLRVPVTPLSFGITADRDAYLELWREACRNAEHPEPAEGTDYLLEGTGQ